jgi:hypothetical protein
LSITSVTVTIFIEIERMTHEPFYEGSA